MLKKKIFKLLGILIFFTSCGYTPLYQNVENLDFKIQIEEVNGERKINNLIKSNLQNYLLNKSDKIYKTSINSNYIKDIIAKDSTGAATEYKIIVKVNFVVSFEDIKKSFDFKESFNMQSMTDKLDEEDYEKNIQTNLVNSITRKLTLRLSKIE